MTQNHTTTPDGSGHYQVRQAFGSFLNAFEQFKEVNDQRLRQLESKLAEDTVTRDKVDRINEALTDQKSLIDDMVLSLKRPQIGTTASPFMDAQERELKTAWDLYARKGDATALVQFERKSLSAQSDPDGGFLVPSEIENTINRVLSQASPIRSIASVRQVSSSSFKKPITTTGAATGWVGETSGRPETNAPALSALEFPTMELYAMPAATQTLLDDAHVNVEEWLADEVQIVFAEQEGAAFINGDGINKPRGFLTYDVVADASYTWGKIGYIASGAAGAFASSDPSDQLIDLIYAPKQAYRANGRWVMNRSVEGELRKFKDADGNYIWQPGIAAGQPATLMGYPVTEAEDMPDIAADALSIAYGDFSRGYLVVDRVGIRVLRDPFTSKPYVLFYTTKRVGGGVQNFEAIKLMKFAAS